MAGERTPDQSPPARAGSTDDEISLREHLQRQLDSLAAAINRRIDDHERLLNERFVAQERALTIALAAIEKRFDSVNEFRAQLNDQAHTFMPRAESLSRHDRTQEQLEKIEKHVDTDIVAINRRLDIMTGEIQGARESKTAGRQSNAAVYAAIGCAVTLLGAVVIIANLLSKG